MSRQCGTVQTGRGGANDRCRTRPAYRGIVNDIAQPGAPSNLSHRSKAVARSRSSSASLALV